MQKSNFLEKQMSMWMQKYEEEQEKNRILQHEIMVLKSGQEIEQPKSTQTTPSNQSQLPKAVPVPIPIPISSFGLKPISNSVSKPGPSSGPNPVPVPSAGGNGNLRKASFSPKMHVSPVGVQGTTAKSGPHTPLPNLGVANPFTAPAKSTEPPKMESPPTKTRVGLLLKRVSENNLFANDTKRTSLLPLPPSPSPSSLPYLILLF
jgi:hypothetical protein